MTFGILAFICIMAATDFLWPKNGIQILAKNNNFLCSFSVVD